VNIGRLGEPREIGELVKFLISKEASLFHGSDIVLDGGNSLMTVADQDY